MEVGSEEGIRSDGKAYAWLYMYLASSNGTIWEMRIKVYGNGDVKKNSFTPSGLSDNPPVNKWTIDSPKAMQIALSNEAIRAFIKEYGIAL